MIYRFEECEFDIEAFELRRGGVRLSIEPQVFEVLRYMIENRDRVVTREELHEAIWQGRIVSDSALSSRIRDARKAVGDSGSAQRLIRTAHGRGFRFIGEVVVDGPAQTPPLPDQPPAAEGSDGFIGREDELATLVAAARDARRGAGHLIFLSGPAGIGKTTLTRQFLDVCTREALAVTSLGQCVEQRDSVEPYLPLLDALSRLCRRDPSVIERLLQHAPMWLSQLPSLLDDVARADLEKRLIGSTRDRMLREFVGFLESQCAEQPLVLALEDLHWADRSTVSVLEFLARRGLPAGLLIVGAYRPAIPAGDVAGFDDVVMDLAAHGCGAVVDLPPLSLESAATFLAARFDAGAVPANLATRLFAMSGGNPLFMGALTDWWVAEGLVSDLPEATEALATDSGFEGSIPPVLLKLIGADFARLADGDRRLLEWAAVGGVAFSSAVVAAAVGEPVDDVEEALIALARGRAFIEIAEESGSRPDAADFTFSHPIYRQVIYAALPSGRRRRMHLAVGRALKDLMGNRAEARAAELADHFVSARAVEDALSWLHTAALRAARRGGHSEALASLRRAMVMLPDLADARLREGWEASLDAAIAANIVATSGIGAAEAIEAYERAMALAERSGQTALLSTVLYELATLRELRGEFTTTQDLLTKRRSFGTTPTHSSEVETAELMACSAFHQGKLATAIEEAEEALSLYDPALHVALTSGSGRNPAVSCEAWAARSLCFTGFPDSALRRIERGLRIAEVEAPFALANACEQAAYVHKQRLEPEPTLAYAAQAIAVGHAHDQAYRVATGTLLAGWARIRLDADAGAVEEMEAALDDCLALGMRLEIPYLKALLAEARLATDDPAGALADLDDALAIFAEGRGYYYDAELHRLRGEALLQAAGSAARDEACDIFGRAFRIAEAQSARLLALRAALSAAALSDDAGWVENTLGPLYRSFTEGFDLPDLVMARETLGLVHETSGA